MVLSFYAPLAPLLFANDDDPIHDIRNTALHSYTTLGLHEYRFPNGSKLVFTSAPESVGIATRVAFFTPQGVGRILQDDKLLVSIPVNRGTPYSGSRQLQGVFSGRSEALATTSSATRFHDAGPQKSRTVEVEVKGGFVVISQDGIYTRFNVNKDLVKSASGGKGPQYHAKRFLFDEKEHVLFSFPYKEVRGGATGESYLIREDGVIVFVSYKYITFEHDQAVPIHDGFVPFEGRYSPIDLEHLEAEANFRPHHVPETPGEKGEKGFDPVAYVIGKYPDMVARERDKIEREAELEEVYIREILPHDDEFLSDPVMRTIRTGIRRKRRGNVVLLGPSGIGKTHRVEQFARAIALGYFPEIPRSTKLLEVTVINTVGGNSLVGMNEQELKYIMTAAQALNCILFIDEIHTMAGAGTHSESKVDLFQHLKPAMSRGQLHIIGGSTFGEFKDAFKGDVALYNRFLQLHVTEPSNVEIVAILRNFEETEGLPKSPDAVLEKIITHSNLYGAVGAQPGRAIDLLDHAHSAKGIDFNSVRRLALELSDIDAATSQVYHVDAALLSSGQALERLKALPQVFQERLVGLAHLKQVLINAGRRRLSGLHGKNEPSQMTLIAGPPGTGKTESAKVYAQAMGLPYKVISMETYAATTPEEFLRVIADILQQNAHTVIILDEIEKAHFRVQNALFSVFNEGKFDVTENIHSGSSRSATETQSVDARHASFIATTNLGQEYLLKLGLDARGQETSETRRVGFNPVLTQDLPLGEDRSEREPDIDEDSLREEILRAGFSKPLLDRFTDVAGTFTPTRRQFSESVRLHLRDRMSTARAELGAYRLKTISFVDVEKFITAVTNRFFTPGISHRKAKRIINDRVIPSLTQALLDRPEPELDLQLSYLEADDRVVCEALF